MPVYGLAECSVALCLSADRPRPARSTASRREPFQREGRAVRRGRGRRDARSSSCRPAARCREHEVRIVDDAGARRARARRRPARVPRARR